jgi:hypothetical protein
MLRPLLIRSETTTNENSKVRLRSALIRGTRSGLVSDRGYRFIALLAQSGPAEAEKPTSEKPSSDEEKISPEKTILGIIGGLAIFLFGVEQLARALKAVSGDRMKRLLARFTTNPFAGLVTGTVATTALDSSSMVIIMTIAMVHRFGSPKAASLAFLHFD